MTKIDFYILKPDAILNRDLLACKIIEKAYKQQHKIYLHTDSEQDARQLDDLLWTFNQGSFIPHQLLGANKKQDELPPPISIGFNDNFNENNSPTGYDVLVNMADNVPNIFSRFTRVAEIVGKDASEKTQARERFKFYRDRGYQLESHELSI